MINLAKGLFLEQGVTEYGFAQGFICGLFPYLPATYKAGNIAAYAVVADYHQWVGEKISKVAQELSRLCPEYSFKPYCDISPYNEVLAAAACGLGVVGKNRLLISPRYGSFAFIGVIRTDYPLPQGVEVPPCIGCNACIKACPTGAICSNGVDRELCLSAVTQRRGVLTGAEEQCIKAQGTAWGCDVCQQVCPMNRVVERGDMPQVVESVTLADLQGLSDREFRKKYRGYAFSFRGVQPIRRNLVLLQGEKRGGL